MSTLPVGTIIADRYQVTASMSWRRAVMTLKGTRLADQRRVHIVLLPRETFGELGPEVERHAALASRIQHDGLVPLLEYGRMPDRVPFFVYEDRPGRNLAEYLFDVGPLTAEQVADLGRGALAVLERAHAAQVIHGNLQPENLIVEEVRPASVVVRMIELECVPPPATLGESSCVTDLSYTAPEVIHGAQPGSGADIYALGLILAEALTTRTLVTGTTPVAVAQLQGSERPVTLPPSVLQSALGPVILGAVRKAPGRRFNDAQLITKALAAAKPGVSTNLDATEGAVGAPMRDLLSDATLSTPHPLSSADGPSPAADRVSALPASQLGVNQMAARSVVQPKRRRSGGGLLAIIGLGMTVIIATAVVLVVVTGDRTEKSDDDDGQTKKKKKKRKKKTEDEEPKVEIDQAALEGPKGSLPRARKVRLRALEAGWSVAQDTVTSQNNELIQFSRDGVTVIVQVMVLPDAAAAERVEAVRKRSNVPIHREDDTIITVQGHGDRAKDQELLELLIK